MTPDEYLALVLSELATNDLLTSFEVVEQFVEPDRGYLRVRAQMKSGGFLELAEYFVQSGEELVSERYRYQWMDSDRTQLRFRWDNVEHFPGMANFPHHVHTSDGSVAPSSPLGILDVLSLIADMQ